MNLRNLFGKTAANAPQISKQQAIKLLEPLFIMNTRKYASEFKIEITKNEINIDGDIEPHLGVAVKQMPFKITWFVGSLKGLGTTSISANTKTRITIFSCPQLAIDPYDYREHFNIKFQGTVPRNIKLVKTVAVTDASTAYGRMPGLFRDAKLVNILNKYWSGGPAVLVPLARELIAAGYEHHVRST